MTRGLPERQRLEALQVARQPPQEPVVGADDAVAGDGRDEDDGEAGHGAGLPRRGRFPFPSLLGKGRPDTAASPASHTATGALIAGQGS